MTDENKIKYCLVVSKIHEGIYSCLNEIPKRGGMFNWLFAFKGDITSIDDPTFDPFKYDIIHVNLSPIDWRCVMRIRELIGPKGKVQDDEVLPAVRDEIVMSLSLPSSDFTIFKGEGCDHCHGTGYYGRTAIYEILPLNERIRGLLTSQPSVGALS